MATLGKRLLVLSNTVACSHCSKVCGDEQQHNRHVAQCRARRQALQDQGATHEQLVKEEEEEYLTEMAISDAKDDSFDLELLRMLTKWRVQYGMADAHVQQLKKDIPQVLSTVKNKM
jgi:hypothetical protein